MCNMQSYHDRSLHIGLVQSVYGLFGTCDDRTIFALYLRILARNQSKSKGYEIVEEIRGGKIYVKTDVSWCMYGTGR